MEIKHCGTCSTDKATTEFNKNKSKKDGLSSICRECSKARSKRYYTENLEHHKVEVRKRSKKTINENREKLFEYYKNNPCIDCGNSNPIVLELDHRDSVEKFDNVSNLVGGGFSWSLIEREIEKCDVRCANCHRIRTAKQFGWYKDLLGNTEMH
jgi:protein-arginine kinase activator protein McsA